MPIPPGILVAIGFIAVGAVLVLFYFASRWRR